MHPLTTERCPVNGSPLDGSLVRRLRAHEGMVLDGRYRLTTKLGEGGNAVVYEAHNLRLARVVAVKLLRVQDHVPGQAVLRLVQEAQLASAAGHPNICTIFDVCCDADQPYIVMEKCVGLTLGETIARRKKIPVPLAVDIMAQILSAVDAAHGANVVHRDLKPKNMFLVPRVGCSPILKVLDFGLAKDVGGNALVTTQKSIALGTPMYMAPEQLATGHVDFRSDLYSCGLILVEMLTGRLPRSSHEILASGGSDLSPSPPPSTWRGIGLGLTLEGLISKALQPNPDHRFQSARDFQSALLTAAPWAIDARELFDPSSSSEHLPSLDEDSLPPSGMKVGLIHYEDTDPAGVREITDSDGQDDATKPSATERMRDA